MHYLVSNSECCNIGLLKKGPKTGKMDHVCRYRYISSISYTYNLLYDEGDFVNHYYREVKDVLEIMNYNKRISVSGRYIQSVICQHNFLVDNDEDVSFISLEEDENLSNVILGEKYDLYNVKTIKQLNPIINIPYFISGVCAVGYVDTLEYLYNTMDNRFDYNENAIFMASVNGHINVLTWWKNSGLELKYSEQTLDITSSLGMINSLIWWKNSGLELKYSDNALNLASENGHIHVLEWWLKSNLPLKYDENALDLASKYGHIHVLEWWLKSNLPLKYDENALDFASKRGHVDVLEWWHKSNLPLKYSSNSIDYASRCGNLKVLEWWFKSNLQLKYTLKAFYRYGFNDDENDHYQHQYAITRKVFWKWLQSEIPSKQKSTFYRFILEEIIIITILITLIAFAFIFIIYGILLSVDGSK
jgi:hypothetical protein